MPFMKGAAPVRRTLQYLQRGQLVFKDTVQIMTVNYNTGQKASKGAYDFVFWHLAQIQYKNPSVQIVTFKNMTPSPFLQFYLNGGKKVLLDIDTQDKDDIHDHVKNILCKSSDTLRAEALAKAKTSNPANFGMSSTRQCICEIPGQVPCPGWVPLKKELRGKYKFQKKDVEES
ncbi:28S ribosomal protein S25, mitochondrial-like [Haliotis rufescens]|uniref:28S ribosomal protein S25, mitochondrial-like n=1 Tax=Haliotis rufescens TaxID=6454 RepID=UPI001EAFA6BC|nr:28S ribosomal protein S25, mitochondrial-like [Haliotis rufescens]XP_046341227.1 28S ribosomal protein S25, mitochondrial-like [Haliotis rufescens]XP_048252935.1 28S ribosomal protein S25, mitochondrial-like [Haliotis rufescens]